MKRLLLSKFKAMVLALSCLLMAQSHAADISQTQLQQLMKSNQEIVILDVRTAEEFAKGHIANAVNISHDELDTRLLELTNAKDKQVVIYCRSGRRAEVARKLLSEQGFKHLDHLSGDFNAWTDKNLPVVVK